MDSENVTVVDEVEEILEEVHVLDAIPVQVDEDDSYEHHITIESPTNSSNQNIIRGKYYKQTYRSAWEEMPDFKGWLRGVVGEPNRAYCTYCQKTLHAHRLSLLKHTCTIRHQKAAQIFSARKNKGSMATARQQQQQQQQQELHVILQGGDDEDASHQEGELEHGEEGDTIEYAQEVHSDYDEDELSSALTKQHQRYQQQHQQQSQQRNNSSNSSSHNRGSVGGRRRYHRNNMLVEDEDSYLDDEEDEDDDDEDEDNHAGDGGGDDEEDEREEEILGGVEMEEGELLHHHQHQQHSSEEQQQQHHNQSNAGAGGGGVVVLGGGQHSRNTKQQILVQQQQQQVGMVVPVVPFDKQTQSNSTFHHQVKLKPPVSTHVLDTTKGQPVTGLQVSLYKLIDGRWTYINEGLTNADGRFDSFMERSTFTVGRYKIHFDVDRYFEARKQDTMYPFIEIIFDCRLVSDSYHIPVILSPYGYSTYRGS